MKRPVSLRIGSDMGYRGNRTRTPHAPREVVPVSPHTLCDVLTPSRPRAEREAHKAARPAGYTLIEILVATTLSLMLLGAVVRMFGTVGEGITDSRAMLEAADRLRIVQARLQQDLAGVTVTMNPPAKPENNEGYFEYIEGPITQANASTYAVDSDQTTTPGDTTVGDFDDILMFTTRSTGRPFVGKCYTTTIQSDVAEVAWFLRGRTLYRRVLLVAPTVNNQAVYTGSNNASGFYSRHDISARPDGTLMVANTLGDLTRRECRFAHLAANPDPFVFPYDARLWRWKCTVGGTTLVIPTLPTLRECSSTGTVAWTVGTKVAPLALSAVPLVSPLDFWTNDTSKRFSDVGLHTNSNGTRVADDVILTNVIGFDVKAWDPNVAVSQIRLDNYAVLQTFLPGDAGYDNAYADLGVVNGNQTYVLASPGAYVDLGFQNAGWTAGNANSLGNLGDARSGLNATNASPARVYDTFSSTYEGDNCHDGFDNDNNGIVDDDLEKSHVPPYPYPLRGVQVKIRIFEPDSKQIREVTVVQEFLPK